MSNNCLIRSIHFQSNIANPLEQKCKFDTILIDVLIHSICIKVNFINILVPEFPSIQRPSTTTVRIHHAIVTFLITTNHYSFIITTNANFQSNCSRNVSVIICNVSIQSCSTIFQSWTIWMEIWNGEKRINIFTRAQNCACNHLYRQIMHFSVQWT